MSGNPFRRAQPAAVQASPYSSEPESPPPTTPAKKKKKKKVKIQTPPRSPEEPPRRLSLGRISPPPPPPTTTLDDEDEESNHPTEADSKLWEAALNTRRNSDSRPPLPSAPTGGGAPYNPFARTLATTEASYNLQRNQQHPNDTNVASNQPGGGRSNMDVDTFKNILLTGNAGNLPPTLQRPQGTDIPGAEGPQSEPRQPGLSFDELESASEDEDEHEDTEIESRIKQDKISSDVLPPMDMPTSDKRLSRGPQTVSFADFNDSFFSGAASSAAQRSGQPVEVGPRDEPASKKAPPPPPVSRRHGQTIPTTGRARSISNVTDDSLQETSQPPIKPSDKSTPPPPPPSRKSKIATQSISPATSTPVQVASPPPGELNTVPPPPPSRNSLKATASVNRTPSNARSSSNSRTEKKPASPPLAPPAPPRRRTAGAERHPPANEGDRVATAASDERDRRRSSSENIPPHGTSDISRAPVSVEPMDPSESGPTTDILADMSAFQAEIDALRARGGDV